MQDRRVANIVEKKDTFNFSIKKKTILIAISIILSLFLLLFSGILFLKSNENGNVIVQGKIVSNIPISLDPPEQNILIPFVAVLQELGYNVTQHTENMIIISDDNHEFQLNLEDQSLSEVGGNNLNYLESPPGFYDSWCYRKDNEIILDVVTFNSALVLMNSDYRIIGVPRLKTVFLY